MAKKAAVKKEAAIQMPTHIFTTSQWKDNPGLQAQLQSLLDNPIFRMAELSLLITAMPNARPVTDLVPGVSAEAMALADSNRYHHRSGMSQYFRGLHNLARAKNTVKRGAEFGELLEEDAI